MALIARAAEGSVRDALSILDQAIVQNSDGGEVSDQAVRDMLGLGDRSRLLDVFERAIAGDVKSAAAETDAQIEAGADPMAFLKDLLEICADVATAQAAGPDYNPGGPPDWIERTQALAQRLTAAQTSRYWRLLLTGYQDAQTAPAADTAARMVVIRLAAAANLPSPEEAARLLASGGAAGEGASGAPASTPSGAGPTSFQDIVALMDERREARLSLESAGNVRALSCKPGELVCDLKDGAPPDLLRRIADFLEDETGTSWKVLRAAAEGGVETLKERALRVRAEKISDAAAHPTIKAALDIFPGAEIVDVRQDGPVDGADDADNVTELQPARRARG